MQFISMAVFWTKQPAPIPSATFIFIFFFFAPCDLAILHNLKVSPSEFIGSVRKVGDVLQNVTSTLKSEFNNVKSVFPLSDAIFACLELLDLSADELSWSISAVESPQGIIFISRFYKTKQILHESLIYNLIYVT